MAGKKNEWNVYFTELPGVRKYWGWFLAIGILLIALGALAIGFENWATEITVVILGVILSVAGVLQISSGLYAARWTGFSLSLFLGLFYIIAGGLCIFKPMQSSLAISLLIAALFLVGGLFRVVTALIHRFDNWGWVVFSGLIATFLGILILAEWPESALWVIGLFVGVDLILMGMNWVRLSMVARK